MKTLSFLILMVWSLKAMTYTCPSYLKENPKALKALEFVKSRQGQFLLGTCQVEVITCDGWEDTKVLKPLAEILIVDHLGREAYAVLNYPQKESSYFSTKTQIHNHMLHYEKTDKLYEEEFGRTEVLRLEMISDDETRFKKIELGLYSTHHQLNQQNGNDSIWFICEE